MKILINIILWSIILSLLALIPLSIVLGIATFKLDWHTGEHGRLTITAVDKNLFGTYTVFARNSDSAYSPELQEITYCIDADNIELMKLAKEKIGVQNTTLVYPEKRIGFYWFNKCGSAPIKEIK